MTDTDEFQVFWILATFVPFGSYDLLKEALLKNSRVVNGQISIFRVSFLSFVSFMFYGVFVDKRTTKKIKCGKRYNFKRIEVYKFDKFSKSTYCGIFLFCFITP